jgi:hypothetical protein
VRSACSTRSATVAASCGRARRLEQHRELVAAQPRHGVAAARGREQPLGHAAQQRVARGVAERVVDPLEAVEVEHQHRHLLGVRAGERLGQPLAQPGAVGQPGERVVQRLVRVGGARVAQLVDEQHVAHGRGGERGERLEHLDVGGPVGAGAVGARGEHAEHRVGAEHRRGERRAAARRAGPRRLGGEDRAALAEHPPVEHPRRRATRRSRRGRATPPGRRPGPPARR